MRRVFEYLNCKWPVYREDETLPRPWLEMCTTTLQLIVDDVEDLYSSATKLFSRRLLSKVQFDERLWAKPSHVIGSVLLVPGDDYLTRTGQPTLQQLREYRELGTRTCGLELEIEAVRSYAHSRLQLGECFPAMIFLKLSLHSGRELDAFRDIFFDYRGIIRKLCDIGELRFSMSSVIMEVDAVRSPKPVPKLDALLRIKDLEPDNSWFDLEYVWYPSTAFEEGFRAFLVQAILFTSIEKAAVSDRARRDYVLDYWRELEAFVGRDIEK